MTIVTVQVVGEPVILCVMNVVAVVIVHLKKMANDEHLHKAFSFFDRNQSGFIEIEELRNALNDEVDTSSEDVINAIMHDVDTDKEEGIASGSLAVGIFPLIVGSFVGKLGSVAGI
ncbi:hypothetical protein AB3S75_037271 [Citrus x aurantiifolia]